MLTRKPPPGGACSRIRFLLGMAVVLVLCPLGRASLDEPRGSVGWESSRNLSETAYVAKLEQMKTKGYRPVDVEIAGGASRRYSVIWRRNTGKRGWRIHTKLTAAAFSKRWKEYKQKGFRIVDQESYVTGGKRFFAGIWIQNKEKLGWASFRNLTSKQFGDRFKEYSGKKYLPVDVEAYKAGAKFLYSVIWVQNKDRLGWAIKRNLPQAQFKKTFDQMSGKGFRIHRNISYLRGGKREYATIWVKETPRRSWRARRDMNNTGYANMWARYRDAGYRLSGFETYRTSRGTRYAGVWVENSARLKWKHRKAVSGLIDTYLKNQPAAGLSAAVAVNGRIQYLRGSGFADIAGKKQAHSRTVYRLASVSKAMAGVLAFRLREQKKLNLGRKTRGYEPRLPSHHTHTVGQLLSNRGRIRHYKTNDPAPLSGTKKIFTTAYSASRLFSADPLLPPGYKYSTHGYTLASAAMEKAGAGSFCGLFSSQVRSRAGVSSLRCENLNSKVGERSKIYRTSGSSFQQLTPLSLSWKYPGGGMESSAYEMARFGISLLNGRILSAASITTMTKRPDSARNYAYGWDTGSTSGEPYFSKGGSQPGARSHLLFYPGKKIVVVLVSNTVGSGISTLNFDIGKLLLAD